MPGPGPGAGGEGTMTMTSRRKSSKSKLENEKAQMALKHFLENKHPLLWAWRQQDKKRRKPPPGRGSDSESGWEIELFLYVPRSDATS